jgi:hypothetical protein
VNSVDVCDKCKRKATILVMFIRDFNGNCRSSISLCNECYSVFSDKVDYFITKLPPTDEAFMVFDDKCSLLNKACLKKISDCQM